MPFSEVQGQRETVNAIRRAFAQGKLHHALLLCGAEGVGKRLTARALSELLLCKAPVAQADGLPDACGRCSGCERVRRAFDPRERSSHPDLFLIERKGAREAEAAAMTGAASSGSVESHIKVEPIREMIQRLSLSAYEGGRRVVYLEDADLMRSEAANAFLKTLEEPGEGVHFILTTQRPKATLNTILSRCQKLFFSPLSVEVMHALLTRPQARGAHAPQRALSLEAAHTLAQLSGGSMSEALHWLNLSEGGEADGGGEADEQGARWLARFNAQLLSLIRTFDLTGGAEALLQAWREIKAYEANSKRDELRRLLRLLRAWYRDVLIFKELTQPAPELLTYPSLSEHTRARASDLSVDQLRWRLQALQDAERDLFERTGANKALTLKALSMYLAGFDAVIGEPLYPHR